MGIRDNIINEGSIVRDYPRCREDETWKHVVLCLENHRRRAEFIYALEQKLPRIGGDIDLVEIADFITDIRSYLVQRDVEYKTNQQYIGMKNLFCRYIVKNWKETDFSTSKYTEYNQVINNYCMKYYIKC